VDSFNDLYTQYGNLVKYQLNEALNDPTDFEDLLQEVWIKIHRNLDKYVGDSFAKWSYSIVRTLCIDYYRRKTAQKRQPCEIPVDDYDDLYDMRYEMVGQSLGCLSDVQQRIILLKIWGLTFGEISKKLKLNFSFTQSSYYSALRTLKKHIVLSL
jgi:RNA polymerase sigma-70 factor (ECF subfamily)